MPRVVPASERRPARLRVGIRRRQPAGAGVGGVAGVRDRRRPRRRVSEPHLRQAARQLHVVGQPARRRRLEPVRGRLPRPGQHRADRSLEPAERLRPEQADATGWMAAYALTMAVIAAVLNRTMRPATDLIVKFLEHFSLISEAIEEEGALGRRGRLLLRPAAPARRLVVPVKVRSMVGVLPLMAFAVVEDEAVCARTDAGQALLTPARAARRAAAGAGRAGEQERPHARRRRRRRPPAAGLQPAVRRGCVPFAVRPAGGLALASRASVPPRHGRVRDVIDYEPAESTTPMFGGNSNWRGPVWFPVNYLVVDALLRYARYFGDG